MRADFDRSCANEEGDQINKMAGFANDPPAAEDGVLSSMVEGDISSIDSVMSMERFAAM